MATLPTTGASMVIGAILLAVPAAAQDDFWPTFADETAGRLVGDPALGVADIREKDYIWGDVDQDGDTDLVCVRKEPWNTPGRFRNVLFMNEGVAEGHAIDGVLVDRTLEFAGAADDGGQGMLDATADRDVALVDVDGDGWLDMITSTTYGQGLAKTISHPRVYINLGESAGTWLGFRYEQARTPTMPIEPNFCGVGVGDVTGDGAPDLYFVEYNNTLEDRLWINDGFGTFTDESTTRLTPEMRESDFGVHAVIVDLNGDGVNDILKDRGSTTTTPPLRVTASWNDPASEGDFDVFEILYDGDPYHVEAGDLNNDGRMDIVVDDDGVDRYLINQGNGPGGQAQWQVLQFPIDSNLFGGNIVIRDVNQDGFEDVFIADVDVDCCGCTRHLHVWRNDGDVPSVAFLEETGGIPDAARTGTHDVAVFDLDGDGWLDVVLGTCTGMSIWVAQPELTITYPNALPPDVVPPGVGAAFDVRIREVAGAQVAPGSATLHWSIDGGPFTSEPLVPQGGDLYLATLPGANCGERIDFYVSAQRVGGGAVVDPPGAPATTRGTVAADGLDLVLDDDIEGDVTGWAVQNDPLLASGAWTRDDPNATVFNSEIAAPEEDATAGAGNVLAFVTENGPPGGGVSDHDVDGGPTHLLTPVFDLAGADGIVSFSRWIFSGGGAGHVPDALEVAISDDGGSSWMPIAALSSFGTNGVWERVSFTVEAHVVVPTATMRVRFSMADLPNDSVAEAGIDDLLIERFACDGPACPGDTNDDGAVDIDDIVRVVLDFGTNGAANGGDVDGSGLVGIDDVVLVVLNFGPCL